MTSEARAGLHLVTVRYVARRRFKKRHDHESWRREQDLVRLVILAVGPADAEWKARRWFDEERERSTAEVTFGSGGRVADPRSIQIADREDGDDRRAAVAAVTAVTSVAQAGDVVVVGWRP